MKNAEIEKGQKKKEEIKRIALQNFHFATIHNSIKYTTDYINIASTLFGLAKDEKYDNLLLCLNGLNLHEGWTLNVDLCKQIGMGSDSHLVVTKGDINNPEIWDCIDVKDEPIAAWQVYLLYSLWHILPHFWHGIYNRRSYIFTTNDILNRKFISSEYGNELISILSNQLEDITPKIAKYNDLYYITCCYWSDWEGLIRESVEIKIVNNKVTSIFNVENTTLFKYHCGIWF